jgi:hypothetical protein
MSKNTMSKNTMRTHAMRTLAVRTDSRNARGLTTLRVAQATDKPIDCSYRQLQLQEGPMRLVISRTSTTRHSPRSRRLLAAVGVAALAVLASPATPPATADVGAGIGADPIVLKGKAVPGKLTKLPAVYIRNTGSEAGMFKLDVDKIADAKERQVPSEWLKLKTPQVRLDAGKDTYVAMDLKVPKSAKLGKYRSYLIVRTAPDGAAAGTGANFGAAAATMLRFEVGNAPFRIDLPFPTWVLWAVGGVLLLLAALHRMGLRVQLDRGDRSGGKKSSVDPPSQDS